MIDIKALHTYVEIGTGPRKKNNRYRKWNTGNGSRKVNKPEMVPENSKRTSYATYQYTLSWGD
jgi:hypothetical protein